MTAMAPDQAARERLYRLKAEAERAEADALDGASASRGSRGPGSAAVLLLKGEPRTGPAADEGPVSDAEWQAALLALEALGLPADDVAVVATRGPHGTAGAEGAAASRLALVIEACDPCWVIALDLDAAQDASEVLSTPLEPGVARGAAGRTWVAVDGLERSLADPERKRRVWSQFKAAIPGPKA